MSRLQNPYPSYVERFSDGIAAAGCCPRHSAWNEGARAVIARLRVHAEENELPALNAWASRLESELDAPAGGEDCFDCEERAERRALERAAKHRAEEEAEEELQILAAVETAAMQRAYEADMEREWQAYYEAERAKEEERGR